MLMKRKIVIFAVTERRKRNIDMICCICGKEFEKPGYGKPFDSVCGSECFGEKLWRIREQEYLDGKPFIIINGCLYTDGGYVKNPSNPSWLGHSGREFNIKMHNGTEIFTNNLWCGGDVPENHRESLCDNAVFVKKTVKADYGDEF